MDGRTRTQLGELEESIRARQAERYPVRECNYRGERYPPDCHLLAKLEPGGSQQRRDRSCTPHTRIGSSPSRRVETNPLPSQVTEFNPTHPKTGHITPPHPQPQATARHPLAGLSCQSRHGAGELTNNRAQPVGRRKGQSDLKRSLEYLHRCNRH